MHCPTPSTFWTRLGAPTCPSHLPGTVPSWPGTFASESLHTSVPEGGTLWGGVIAGVSAAVRDLFYTRFVIFIL